MRGVSPARDPRYGARVACDPATGIRSTQALRHRRRAHLALALALLAGPACAVADRGFHEPWIEIGTVIKAADGDTLQVATAGHGAVTVRLAGIDAPERGQAHWRAARGWLVAATTGRAVTIGCYKRDRHGREVCRVWVGGLDVPAALVAAGLAWHYADYAAEQTPEEREAYPALEASARRDRRGLWQDPDPQRPDLCRQARRRRAGCR